MPKGSTFGGPAPAKMEEEEPQISLEDLAEALGGYHSLPPVVRRRVDALTNLHKQYITINKQYQAEVREIEKKYSKLYEPIFDKRSQVIAGAHEPNDEEAKLEKPVEVEEGVTVREAQPEDKDIKGIPEFWLTVMHNNGLVSSTIQERDEEALSYLKDVRCAELEGEPRGFVLTFQFAENPFFSNTTLTKTYLMEEDELFGELVLDTSKGTEIEWKAGKNLTVEQIKKKVKAKGKGKPPKTVTVEEPCESFFNFFSPPVIPEEDAEEEEPELIDELQDALEMDFDVGSIFKEKLVPFSLLWFTGEAAEYENDFGQYDDEDEFDDEEDDEEDEDDDEEEDEAPKKGGRGHGHSHGHGHGHGHAHGHKHGSAPAPSSKGGNAPGQPQQPECKQQ